MAGARLLQEIATANGICPIDFDNYLFAGAGDKRNRRDRQARPLLAHVFTEDEFNPTPEQETLLRDLFVP